MNVSGIGKVDVIENANLKNVSGFGALVVFVVVISGECFRDWEDS